MKYRVNIAIKDGVLDPEMETLQRLLKRSGVKGIAQLTHIQQFDMQFEEQVNEAEAERLTRAVAADVLANPEIHDWTVERL
jgi:phosphoribosylformylglycinamidine synthase PurS subunit